MSFYETTEIRKRSAKLREAAINYFSKTENGLKCCVCGFDFYKKYGNRGRCYIEIHHEKPISQYETEDINTTIKEAIHNLKPVCSNCHRMIHRYSKAPLTIEKLKRIIKDNEKC